MALFLTATLFMLGVWGLVNKRHLVKKIMGLGIINSAIVLLFVYMGSLTGADAPILVEGATQPVDPLPQALMLTAIVVGICVTALSTVFIYIIHQRHGTLDMRAIEKRSADPDA